MGWESSDVVRFDLGPPPPPFKVKREYPNLKVFITHLLLVVEVCNVKPTCRKLWAGNLLMWSDLTLSPSFEVKRGNSNLKVLITRLLLILEVWNLNQLIGNHGLGIF